MPLKQRQKGHQVFFLIADFKFSLVCNGSFFIDHLLDNNTLKDILQEALLYVNLCKKPRGEIHHTLNIGAVEPTQYLQDSERMTLWKSLGCSVVNVVLREVPQVIRLSFRAAPLRTV